MHFREVRIASPADETFASLVAILEAQRFDLQTVDRTERVVVADSTSSRGWIFGLLVVMTLGLVGQSRSVRVTARVDEAGDEAVLLIEARQLYGWPAPYDFSNDVDRLLRELGRRLGPDGRPG